MKTSIHTRLAKAVALVVMAAGVAVPAAGAGNPPQAPSGSQVARTLGTPDTRDAASAVRQYSASQVARDLGTPDTRDAARAALAFSASQVARTLGTPDTRDAARVALEAGASSEVASALGTPDTRDAALLARTQVVRIVGSGGFDWGDAGIGAGSGIGLVLLLGVAGSMLVRQKHRLSGA